MNHLKSNEGSAGNPISPPERAEIEDFNRRAKARFIPHEIDIRHHYYLPLTTFAEQGNPERVDNRYPFYQRHFDELEQYSGKRVLNVACGIGELSLLLAYMGADVSAMDFAPEAVEVARKMADINGHADRIKVDVMDIRDLKYPSNSFDLVTGEHALHHIIKYENCFENIYRVLKPGGKALFWENFTFDPIIRLMRPINWYLKGYVGEYSLGKSDLDYARRVFDEVVVSDKALFFTYCRFFRRSTSFCRKVTRLLKGMDDALLDRIPLLNRLYSLAFLELYKR